MRTRGQNLFSRSQDQEHGQKAERTERETWRPGPGEVAACPRGVAGAGASLAGSAPVERPDPAPVLLRVFHGWGGEQIIIMTIQLQTAINDMNVSGKPKT